MTSVVDATSELRPERPRLLFFRWVRPGLPDFLTQHLRDQVRCLGNSFDVVVVDRDCDYDEECDRYQPDLTLFESGVYAGPRSIANTQSHASIPRLGFLHADAFDASRATFLSDMDRWGVDTFFTLSVSMAEYTPEIADRLFVWPNFVDPDVFRDYGEPKRIPVLFTGSRATHYPWRNEMSRVLPRQFPTMTSPHFGWNGEDGSTRMPVGESYARLLSASMFVPACGTVTKDLVRKHLEVPASGACLVAEKTASLEALGFQDMVNCVFADASDVVDKLDHLVANPDVLSRVTRAGHDLVHSAHTMQHRDQIFRWWELNRDLRPGQSIVQEGPFGSVSLVDGRPSGNRPVISLGRDRTLLTQAWSAMQAGSLGAAERLFLRCLNFYFIPEAVVGLAICKLNAGDASAARKWLERTLVMNLEYQHAVDPDPVQWSCRIRIELCEGRVRQAVEAASRYGHLRHPELDRMRAVVRRLAGAAEDDAGPAQAAPRASVTPLPQQSPEDWLEDLLRMMRACGQGELVDHMVQQRVRPNMRHQPTRGIGRRSRDVWRTTPLVGARSRWGSIRLADTSADWARSKLRPVKRRLLEDDWSILVQELARREPVRRAFILGHSHLSRGERALRRGLAENPSLPEIIDVGADASGGLVRGQVGGSLVFVTRKALADPLDAGVLFAAEIVVIEGINESHGFAATETLLRNGRFTLLAHQPDQGTGYVALRRAGAR